VRVPGSAIFFGVLVTLAAGAIDPAVHYPYLTPKRYALFLASAVGLLFLVARAPSISGGRLQLTAIEITLLASITWGVITNPDGLATQAGSWFWLPLATFVLTLVVRQLFNPSSREGETSGATTRLASLSDFLTALWIVGTALAVHGLAEALRAGGFRPEDIVGKTLVTSSISISNAYGAFMATGIIAAVASAAAARTRQWRVLLATAALLQLVALIGNGSRGALLGLVSAGLFVLWLRVLLRPATHPRPGLRAVVPGVAVLVVVLLAGLALYRLDPTSGRGRLMAWEVSSAMLYEQPFTGVGAGRFSAEWGRYQAELWRHPDYAEFDRQALGRLHPNSELFNRLAERGVPGGALYVILWALAIGFVVRAIRRNERTPAVDWGLLALLVAILVHSLVDGVLRWEPTLLTAHLALGLIPAPALLAPDLRRRWVRLAVAVIAVAWAATVAFKTVREYPGYQLWGKAWSKDEAERLDMLVRAQRRLPWEPGLDHGLGVALVEAGRFEEAESVLEQGLEAQDNASARLALAEAQLGLGWLEPAEVSARTAAAGYPDRLGPRLLLARIHHANGEDAQARAALASSIRRDTHFRSAAVDSMVAEATLLWRAWYDDEPPR
jgi:O-antigen ligase